MVLLPVSTAVLLAGCATFLMRVETNIEVKKTYGRDAKRKGTPGNGFWAGRIKVLRENKANMNIEAENMKQEKEAGGGS
jgi:hypothetical protein